MVALCLADWALFAWRWNLELLPVGFQVLYETNNQILSKTLVLAAPGWPHGKREEEKERQRGGPNLPCHNQGLALDFLKRVSPTCKHLRIFEGSQTPLETPVPVGVP